MFEERDLVQGHLIRLHLAIVGDENLGVLDVLEMRGLLGQMAQQRREIVLLQRRIHVFGRQLPTLAVPDYLTASLCGQNGIKISQVPSPCLRE